MKITLSPVRKDIPLTLDRRGETLVFNGVEVPLGDYDHDSVPCEWIVETPVKVRKEWHVSLVLPHGNPAPQETLFPAVLTVTEDGPVELPPYESPIGDTVGVEA